MAVPSKRAMLRQVRETPSRARRMILYKDDDLVAVNKPPGVAVHGGPGVKEELIDRLPLIQGSDNEQLHLAHRIDKNTSGVVLLTRHPTAAARIATLFKERKIVKKYWAVTVGVPQRSKGSIQIPLGSKNMATEKGRHMHRVVLRPDRSSEFSTEFAGKTLSGDVLLAWTDYSILSASRSQCCLLDVRPLTGFKHQIRVHLADGLLCPVLGDYKFAGPLFRLSKQLSKKMTEIANSPGYKRGHTYLHAYELQVPQDGGKPLVINAPPPEYFVRTVQALGLTFPQQYQKLVKHA